MLSMLSKNFSRHLKIFINLHPLWANSADDKLIFFLFFQENRFCISCKLSLVCMKCQSFFSWKNKKNINLSSAEFAKREVKVNEYFVLNLDKRPGRSIIG